MSKAEKIKLIVYVNFVRIIKLSSIQRKFLIDILIQILLGLALVYVIYTTVQLQRALPSATDAKYPEEVRRVKHRIVLAAISWSKSFKFNFKFQVLETNSKFSASNCRFYHTLTQHDPTPRSEPGINNLIIS